MHWPIDKTNLHKIEGLRSLRASGMCPGADVGHRVHNVLVQDWHSQVEEAHQGDDEDAQNCSQLQAGSVRPHIHDGSQQEAGPRPWLLLADFWV